MPEPYTASTAIMLVTIWVSFFASNLQTQLSSVIESITYITEYTHHLVKEASECSAWA